MPSLLTEPVGLFRIGYTIKGMRQIDRHCDGLSIDGIDTQALQQSFDRRVRLSINQVRGPTAHQRGT